MNERYTVSENPFGYESDVGTHRLRYALTDNKPTHASTYVARDRERRLIACMAGDVPFRHLCYGAHKEDLQALADAMNFQVAMYGVEGRDHGVAHEPSIKAMTTEEAIRYCEARGIQYKEDPRRVAALLAAGLTP